jgi:hypothetical protein
MTYVTLELFRDRAAEDRIGVEGFDSLEAFANFTLLAADRVYPAWATVRADHHNDLREVLSMLDTIESTARFLVGLEYDEAEVRRTLAAQFPGEDIDAALADARQHKARLEAEVAAIEGDQAAAAVESEHDLSKSMHDQP